MNRFKIILTDSHRGAIEAFAGVVVFGGLLGFVLWLVIFIGQVLP